MFRKLKNAECKRTLVEARDYSNKEIKFIGETNLTVQIGNSEAVKHKFLVVNDNFSALIGRDLATKLKLQIELPVRNRVSLVDNTITSLFKDYLSPNFKSNVSYKVKFDIEEGSKPVFCKARPLPYRFRVLVKEELARLRDCGIIEPVKHSYWACPIVPVLKANGKIRITGDFSTTINKFCKKVSYPMPTVENVLSIVGNAKIFSKIDLANAYLQLPLDESAKTYTVINTTEGLFQYHFLPYGVSSASAIFQSFISQVLSNINNVIVYQDDILIMSETREEHENTLIKVLNCLKNSGVKVNTEKCTFFSKSVTYLGYVFDEDGAKPSIEKTRAIVDAPVPTNVKQVQAFIGLCNYYSRFIKNFSSVFAPLYALLKKDTKFSWDKSTQEAFDVIKNMFSSNKVLKLFDPKLETAIETDASPYGIGAVLLQKHNNHWLPVQFASRTLNTSELNYSQIDKEALSVLFGCERFREFLLGSCFTIRTDHKPLLKLLGHDKSVPINCSMRLQRWALRLSIYNYQLVHIPGHLNVQSDCLSRLPLKETSNEPEPAELVLLIKQLKEKKLSCEDIKKFTDSDPDLSNLRQYVMYGFPPKVKSSLSPYIRIRDELSLLRGCIMWRDRVIIPNACRDKVIEQLHDGHPGIHVMKAIARSLVWYPKIDVDITNIVKSCQICTANSAKPSQNSKTTWPTPDRKWSRLHIDHFFLDNYVFLVVIDALTKYIECEIVKTVNSSDTIDALRTIFSRNGLPNSIVSDNATSFTSDQFASFLNDNLIAHTTSPPYCPFSNGQGEAAVKVVKNLLKKNTAGSIKIRLANVLLHYRNTPHSITGVPPAVALNGRNYITIKERLNPKFASNTKEKFDKAIKTFDVGDSVLVLNLRDEPKWLPGVIVECFGDNVYNDNVLDLNVV